MPASLPSTGKAGASRAKTAPGPEAGGDAVPSPALPRIGALIRARRQQARLTLRMLGERAALSTGYLSQIERDQATPSLATLAQVAQALGVGVDYFIAAPRAQDALSPAAGRPRFSIGDSSLAYERLSTEFPGNEMSSFIIHVPPGYHSETVSHAGEEIVFVLDGRITQWIDRVEIPLGPGDALHFRGNRHHAWANHSAQPARLLWAGTLHLLQSLAGPEAGPASGPDTNQKPAQPAASPSSPKE